MKTTRVILDDAAPLFRVQRASRLFSSRLMSGLLLLVLTLGLQSLAVNGQPLKIDSFQIGPGGNPQVSFLAQSNYYYYLLRGPLTNVSTYVSGGLASGTNGLLTDPVPAGQNSGMFYRLLQIPAGTAPLRIERMTVGADGTLQFYFFAKPDSYYILYRGLLNSITFPVAMGIMSGTNGVLRDPHPVSENPSMFYRVLQVPLNSPLDTDGDGIDDVTEMQSGLNPLNPADAPLQSNGDFLSNLEKYNLGLPLSQSGSAPPQLLLSAAGQGANVSPADVSLSASLSQTSIAPDSIEFFSNGRSVGTVSSPPFTMQLNRLSAGTYSFNAIAHFHSTTINSDVVNFTVSAPAPTGTNAIINPPLQTYDFKMNHAAMIAPDGTLWTYGENDDGQLGDGQVGDIQPNPVQISTSTNWISVAVGRHFTLALKQDGTIWSCGGVITQGYPRTLTQVGTSSNWQRIFVSCAKSSSSGSDFNDSFFGVQSDGSLWAWGYTFSFDLFGSGQTFQSSPAVTSFDERCVGITRGMMSEIGPLLLSENEQLNINTDYFGFDTFALATAGSDWTQVETDIENFVGLGLQNDESLWFLQSAGSPGVNPSQVLPGTRWKTFTIAAPATALAIKDDGTLWMWSLLPPGTLDAGLFGATNTTPVDTQTGNNWVSVRAGHSFSLIGLKQDGSMWEFGKLPISTVPCTGTNLSLAQLAALPLQLLPLPIGGTAGPGNSSLISSTSASATSGMVDATGNLPVQFVVDSSGAATFSIAVGVPPGTAGMQPDLGIAYSSHAGNGLLGMGASLSGLSAITRAAKTIAQDGAPDGVNFDGNDRFALDGQRLVAINGAYGADGTEYRTEMDSFSRIISYGQFGHGPAFFRVWTKSGQIMDYGNTSDSSVKSSDGNEVLLWALNQVTDRVGNYLSVAYSQPGTNGEYYPLSINYGGNTNAATPHYASVNFGYEQRPDIIYGRVGSYPVQITQILTSIETAVQGSTVFQYRLTYDQGIGTGRSRLRDVTLCDANGVCFPPSHIDNWQDMTYSLDFDIHSCLPSPGYNVAGDNSEYKFFSGDFDGDGKTDLIHFPDSSHYNVWHNVGSNTFTLQQYSHPINSDPNQYLHYFFLPGDFNGDGRTDFLHIYDTSFAETWLAQPDGTFQYVDCSPPNYELDQHPGGVVNYYTGDWNGDGRTDVIHIVDPATAKVWLSLGDGTFNIVEESVAEYDITRNPTNFFPCDLNGDGKTDLIHIVSSVNYYAWLSHGDGHFTRTNKPAPSGYDLSANNYKWITGDFNGDGRTDFIHFYDPNTAYVWLGKGNGDFDIVELTSASIYSACAFSNGSSYNFQGLDRSNYKFEVADFNGDGKTDLIQFFDKTNAFIWISKGDGTFKVTRAIPPTAYDLRGDAGATGDDGFRYLEGDFNGDGKTDLIHLVDPSDINVWYGLGPFPDIPTQITDGQGNSVSITYNPLTIPTFYTPDTNSVYPIQDMRGPLYVVTSHRLSDGEGGSYEIRQSYAGAKSDLTGRGFLGFRAVNARDMRDGLLTQTDYRQDFPFNGEVADSQLHQPNGWILDSTTNVWGDTVQPNSPPIHFVHMGQTQARTYELDGSLITTTTTSNAFDSYGNGTYVLVDSGDGFSKTTASQFYNDTTDWILGRLTESQVTSTAPGQPTLTRTSGFGYYGDGLLQYEEIEPGNATLQLRTDYQYDAFGNKTLSTVTGPDIATRSASAAFDGMGRFLLRTTNALGQVVSFQHDPRFGVLSSSTDLNGLTTQWTYDTFGRKIQEIRPDGTHTEWTYALGDGDSPPLSTYLLQAASSGEPPASSYFDKLGRVLRKSTLGFNGRKIFQDTQYDNEGRVANSSRPYFPGDPIYWNSFTYDVLGRTRIATLPDDSTTTTTYAGLTTTVENALGQNFTQIKDSEGHVVKTIDNKGNQLLQAYDAFGNLVSTTDPSNNVVRMSYDLRGRRLSLTDPDAGHWTNSYDALGEMLVQRDAKGQMLTNQYDILGRLVRRTEPEGVSQWTYDTAPNGVGALALAQGPGGYSRSNSYDSLSRPSTTTTTIAGSNYLSATTYDSFSRVDQVVYSSGVALKHVYDTNGYLTTVSNLAESALVWQANSMNSELQLTSDTLGNGVTTTRAFDPERAWIKTIHAGAGNSIQNLIYAFNALGTLTNRQDLNQSLSESFLYDGLNRLTNATITGRTPKSYRYDTLGNLTYKSDVGSYTYGGNGSGPHAVSVAGGVACFYDANGNQTNGDGRTVTYNSFNKPLLISKGGNSSVFAYDCDHARVLETSEIGGVASTTTFVNALYETVANGTSNQQRHYFLAGGALVAIYTRDLTGNTVTQTQTRYVHGDHLGSLETLTDETGAAVERFSYDPHGKRRDADWNDIPSGSLTSPTTQRAFTGHLQLDSLDIVNMGGRIYDPVLGRMLNADPFVQNASDLQAFNRYTYVINNPLSLTDPSGYFSLDNVTHFFRTYGREIGAIGAAAVITAATSGYGAPVAFGGALAGGATAGAIQSRGDARAILISTATAAAFYGVGSAFAAYGDNSFGDFLLKTAAHGLVGGVSSSVQGGSFGAGFTSAAFTEAVSGDIESIRSEDYSGLAFAARVTAASMAGGYAAELGGGKFKNGAITGAFSYLFNETKHEESQSESTLDRIEDLWERIKLIATLGRLSLDFQTCGGDVVGACAGVSLDYKGDVTIPATLGFGFGWGTSLAVSTEWLTAGNLDNTVYFSGAASGQLAGPLGVGLQGNYNPFQGAAFVPSLGLGVGEGIAVGVGGNLHFNLPEAVQSVREEVGYQTRIFREPHPTIPTGLLK